MTTTSTPGTAGSSGPGAPREATDDVAVRITGLTKRFGATVALDRAGLVLRSGSVHSLIGSNGCGKSTTIKVLAGVHRGDAGDIEVAGSRWDAADYDARAGRAGGLRFVHQDLGLFPALSVAENIALDAGYPAGPGRRIRWRVLHRRVQALLDTYEIDAAPTTPLRALRPAQRTMVAIARALQDGDQAEQELVLVLDEPTASLAQHESQVLLSSVRRRADAGQTVLLVSHRMPEVLSISDDITVFRDGRTVATLVDAQPTEHQLVALMTGGASRSARPGPPPGRPALPGPRAEPSGPVAGPVHLVVSGLTGGPLRGVDLQVRRGEIVGVVGLVGSGRTSLLKTVFGEHAPVSGTVRIGQVQDGSSDVPGRMAAGVAYVSEDRGGESAFADLTVRENLSASVVARYWRPWGMAAGRERHDAAALVRRFGIRTPSAEAPLAALSGGNQQKAVLARWLRREPTLLLLDEPTQGVDVMSRQDIYDSVRAAAARECAVLVASSDLLELCLLCDRVVVLQDGRVTAEVTGTRLSPDVLFELTQSTAGQPAPERGAH